MPDNVTVFASIYQRKAWGEGDDFYSGEGSHEPAITGPYVAAVSEFLQGIGRPKVVDLGCGDFAVGSQLVEHCREYVGCDVVPDLIERNRRRFTRDGLRFEVADIGRDRLPSGDVALVRQVLQHLSNDQIALALPRLAAYKYLIVTEHLPGGDFVPNRDKSTGGNIRLDADSGVVLEAAPFHLRSSQVRVLCTVPSGSERIQTTLYIDPAL